MRSILLAPLLLALACSSSDPITPEPGVDAGADVTTAPETGTPVDASEASAPVDSSGDASIVNDLLAKIANCKQVSNGKYKTDDEPNLPENIPVCGLTGAVWWTSDMDIDCDGKQTTQCNKQTDAAYQNQTAATDSKGDPLDAAALPYVVIPGTSARFSYPSAGLKMGSVVAVLYNGKLEFGILGDVGPSNIIGEASYAMAKNLGIDPDPSTGGVDNGVTYIAFTGTTAVVKKKEDHAEAVTLGQSLAADLIKNN